MTTISLLFLLLAILNANAAEEGLTTLWNFEDGSECSHDIKLVNDPVMGGVSFSNYTVKNSVLNWKGEVREVPSLSAPGFANIETTKIHLSHKFPSLLTSTHLTILLKPNTHVTQAYKGFKISFGSGHTSAYKMQFNSFKSDFYISDGTFDKSSGYVKVSIPFGSFSKDWSPYTGEAVVKCSENESVCPHVWDLETIRQVGLWAEGYNGEFDLDVLGVYGETIKLTTATAVETMRDERRACKMQHELKFGVTESSLDLALPGGTDTESLAHAICCNEEKFPGYAEPRDYFKSHDLFLGMNKKGVTTFYDSACGLPVFNAPINRSFLDFVNDTNEHGWPSFRGDEIIMENVYTGEDGKTIYSNCCTKLGTWEEDGGEGRRACIDLVCIAGHGHEKILEIK